MNKKFTVKLNSNIRNVALRAKAKSLESSIIENQLELDCLQSDVGSKNLDPENQDLDKIFALANFLQEQIDEYERVVKAIH